MPGDPVLMNGHGSFMTVSQAKKKSGFFSKLKISDGKKRSKEPALEFTGVENISGFDESENGYVNGNSVQAPHRTSMIEPIEDVLGHNYIQYETVSPNAAMKESPAAPNASMPVTHMNPTENGDGAPTSTPSGSWFDDQCSPASGAPEVYSPASKGGVQARRHPQRSGVVLPKGNVPDMLLGVPDRPDAEREGDDEIHLDLSGDDIFSPSPLMPGDTTTLGASSLMSSSRGAPSPVPQGRLKNEMYDGERSGQPLPRGNGHANVNSPDDFPVVSEDPDGADGSRRTGDDVTTAGSLAPAINLDSVMKSVLMIQRVFRSGQARATLRGAQKPYRLHLRVESALGVSLRDNPGSCLVLLVNLITRKDGVVYGGETSPQPPYDNGPATGASFVLRDVAWSDDIYFGRPPGVVAQTSTELQFCRPVCLGDSLLFTLVEVSSDAIGAKIQEGTFIGQARYSLLQFQQSSTDFAHLSMQKLGELRTRPVGANGLFTLHNEGDVPSEGVVVFQMQGRKPVKQDEWRRWCASEPRASTHETRPRMPENLRSGAHGADLFSESDDSNDEKSESKHGGYTEHHRHRHRRPPVLLPWSPIAKSRSLQATSTISAPDVPRSRSKRDAEPDQRDEEIRALRTKTGVMGEEVKQLRDIVKELRAKRPEAGVSSLELERVKSERDELLQQVDELRAANAALESSGGTGDATGGSGIQKALALADSQKQMAISRLEKEHALAVERLQAEFAEALQEAERAQHDLEDQLNAKQNKLLSDQKSSAESHESEVKSAFEKIRALERELTASKEAQQTLSTECHAMRDELKESRQTVQDLTESSESWRKRAIHFMWTHGFVRVRMDQLSVLAQEGQHARDEIAVLRERMAAAEESLQAAEARAAAAEAATKDAEERCQRAVKAQHEEMTLRKKLHNLVQELRGGIRVYCRVRPLLSDELKSPNTELTTSFPLENQVEVFSKKSLTFEFDRVFGPSSGQEDVFADVQDLVTSALDGYNVCVFAYGQTGSGKTHTMEGSPGSPGITYRALEHLFNEASARAERLNTTFNMNVSIYEVGVSEQGSQEQVRDLLCKDPSRASAIEIIDNKNQFQVVNLTSKKISSAVECAKFMEQGAKNRATGVTNMNQHSSRSHLLVTITIESSMQSSRAGAPVERCFGKLHLCDLAGSENVNKSGATGARLKEAQFINKSLSALRGVITALAKNSELSAPGSSSKEKPAFVPYRDSKLTHLLKDSLGFSAKVIMFVNLSPYYRSRDETVSSLRFGSVARSVCLGQSKANRVAA
eukprot:Rmarinus@m.2288